MLDIDRKILEKLNKKWIEKMFIGNWSNLKMR